MIVEWSDTMMWGEGGPGGRLLRGYVQNGLAAQVANDAGSGTDEEVLMRMMLRVRRSVLNPRTDEELRFDPRFWPALVAGVGYCDQINGAICLAAAHRFPKAELVGLYDPKTRALPHTVGRVWSRTRAEWLYFDAFYAESVIYTRDATGVPKVVLAQAPLPWSSREPAPEGTYALAGWPLGQFHESFAMYIVSRLRPARPPEIRADARAIAPKPNRSNAGMLLAAPIVSAETSGAVVFKMRPPSHRNDEAYSRIVRSYAQARAEHLLGVPSRDAYRAVADSADAAADDRAAEIAFNARRFAERPSL